MPDQILFKNEIIRKALHMLLSVSAFALKICDPDPLINLFLILTLVYLTIDISRLKFKQIKKIYNQFFGIMLRYEEDHRLTGASFAFVGASLTLLLFDLDSAISAILIVGLSDAVAALVGRKIGFTRIGDKSLEGSFAFFIVTLIILFAYTGTPIINGLTVAFLCTIIELVLPKWLNDNLMIPISAGLLITVI